MKRLLIGLILLVLLFSGCSSTTDKTKTEMPLEEIKSKSIEVSYDDLFRNNSQYVGKIVYFRGKIIQAIDGYEDEYTLRVNVTLSGFYWEDTVLLNYEGARFLEDDIIDFWGEVKGIKSYTAVLGNKVSVPEIDVLHLELASSDLEVAKNNTDEIVPEQETNNLLDEEQISKAYWQSTAPFSIMEYKFGGTTSDLEIQNVSSNKLTLTQLTFNEEGSLIGNEIVFNEGEKKSIELTELDDCGNTNTTFNKDVIFTYNSKNVTGLAQIGEKQLTGKCG